MRVQVEVRLKVLGLSASLLQSCSSAGSRDQACTTIAAVYGAHSIAYTPPHVQDLCTEQQLHAGS